MSNIVKGSGIIYTTNVPNTIPNINTDAEFAVDVNGNQYAWNRSTSVWDNLGQSIEVATSSNVPTHTPSNFRPKLYITTNGTLYHYSGSVWNQSGISFPTDFTVTNNYLSGLKIYNPSNTNVFKHYTYNDDQFKYENTSAPANSSPWLQYYNALRLSGTLQAFQDGAPIILREYYYNDSGTDRRVLRETYYTELSGSSKGGELVYSDASLNQFLAINSNKKYAYYKLNQTSSLIVNDRSIPDVGTIKQYLGRNYKLALLEVTQSSTNNPVIVTELVNDLGISFDFIRIDVGDYTLSDNESNGYFTKTFVHYSAAAFGDPSSQLSTYTVDDNTISIKCFNSNGSKVDMDVTNLLLELRLF